MKTNNKLTVGLIGCGRIGSRTDENARRDLPPGWLPLNHAEAIQSLPDLSLVAVCDIDPRALSTTCEKYDVATAYSDYRSLILNDKPDIVSIATRTFDRCKIIRFATENGVKAIHSEKPISLNIYECRKALESVANKGVFFSYGTYRRFNETYRKAKEILNSGEIGELREICIEHGRTMLLWSHPHTVDLMLYYADCLKADFVQSHCSVNDKSFSLNMIDDDPFVEYSFIKFQNGVNGVITSSPGMNTRLSGTSGTIVIVGNGSWIELRKRKNKYSSYFLNIEKIEVQPEMSGTQRAFFELAFSVKNNRNLLSISIDDILAGQRILLSQAYSSINHGKPVDPLQLDENFTVTGKFGSHYA
jgi:predicted dehydrogenase